MKQEEGRSGGDGGNIELKLSEVNTRAVSRGQKMVAGDLISRHTFQQELKGSWRYFVWIVTGRGKLSGLVEEDWWEFILVDKLFLVSLT